MKANMDKLILVFVLAILFGAVVGSLPEKASALATVGVTVGNVAEYSFLTTGNSTLISSFFNLTYARVTVTAISQPTNITSQVLETFTNTTQKTITNFVDVDNGYGNGSGIFIGANLNTNDLIYAGDVSVDQWAGARINETITKNYLGSGVSVNHYNKTEVFKSAFLNETASLNYYWFKTSGMLAELSAYVSIRNATSFQWLNISGIITSTVPEFPAIVIPPLFIAVSAIAVVLARKKIHRKRQV